MLRILTTKVKLNKNIIKSKYLVTLYDSIITGNASISNYVNNNNRYYHSYPDPNEKPVITQTKSSNEKLSEKSSSDYQLHEKFKLDKLFPGVPVSKGIGSTPAPPTDISKLDNGLTVASRENPGMMTTIALIIRCGSSYEVQTGSEQNTGVTHFLELNAFRSTQNRQGIELIEEVEQLGGMVQCVASRETIIYVIDVLRPHVERAMDILADAALRPVFPPDELEESRQIVQFQQDEMPAEILSRDVVQMAAYQGSPLGHAYFCPVDKLPLITTNLLQDFRHKYFFGENCVLAAAGIDHNELVKLAKDKFSTLPTGKRSRDGTDLLAESTYTGGLLAQQRTLKEPFVKLAIAWEVGGWDDEQLVPMCVMHQLLGGGSSFSAGGPGKGMYTRLYTEVLNRHYWAESVESFMAVHERSGIMGIDGACPPDKLANMVRVIVDQICKIAVVPIPAEELTRAKNMLKSSMMMQLESRLVQCEDIARQLVTYGRQDSAGEMCDKIDAVTAADVMKVAQRMLESKPSVGCVGHDVSFCPPYSDVEGFVKAYYHSMWQQNTPKK